MKKRNISLIIGIVIVLGAIAVGIIVLNYNGEGEVIGGDEDTHGCLIGAGYAWNQSIGSCVREWELDVGQRRAANIAIMPLSYYVTVTEVIKQDCEGCYIVKMQRNDNRQMEEIIIKNWQITSSTDGGTGEQGKKTYCKSEQRDAQVCTMEYAPVCGWYDDNIQCIKYPCATTYSNPCMACSQEKVAYWTNGECPN